jgi:hypothetical protein
LTRRRRPTIAATVAKWREYAVAMREMVSVFNRVDEIRLAEESIADFVDRQCNAIEAGDLTYIEFHQRIIEMFAECESIYDRGAVPVIIPADVSLN